ncbi:MAG: signal peptidase II, partial [Methylocystis sp.]|nr:signal peptidase II [Methylocystis sp.]
MPAAFSRAPGLVALAAALVLDQAHKFWMLDIFDIKAKAPVTLTPFLDVVLSWNHGVSYSLFPAHETGARLALLAFQGLVVAVLAFWMLRAQSRATSVAFGLIIGGALGNICDRLF